MRQLVRRSVAFWQRGWSEGGRLCHVGGAFGTDEEPEAAPVAAEAVGFCKVGQTEPSAEAFVSRCFPHGPKWPTRSS